MAERSTIISADDELEAELRRFYGTVSTRGRRKCEILHDTPNPLKPISPKSTYLPTPNLGNFLVIWGKFLVNFKIRIFYIIFRVFYN